MSPWANFFFAEVGASAALAGLIFVSVSINLSRILSLPALPNRALGALVMLITVLVTSSLMLVPGQAPGQLGVEALLIGLGVWVIVLRLDVEAWRQTEARFRRRTGVLIVMNQVTLLLYGVAGVCLIVYGAVGLYWLVPASLLSIVKALLDAWVLLVEINR